MEEWLLNSVLGGGERLTSSSGPFTPGKSARFSSWTEVCWKPRYWWATFRQDLLLPLPAIEPRFHGRLVRNLVTVFVALHIKKNYECGTKVSPIEFIERLSERYVFQQNVKKIVQLLNLGNLRNIICCNKEQYQYAKTKCR